MATAENTENSPTSFQPNQEFLDQLLQLGITRNAALKVINFIDTKTAT